MIKLSNEQLTRLTLHATGINTNLLDALLSSMSPEPDSVKPATALKYEDLPGVFNPEDDPCPFDADFQSAPVETAPKSFTIYDYDRDDCRKRIELMSRLCGRWKPKGARCEIEIERRGEHFILYYLKRNGARTEDRYALLWSYGDVYYCCAVNRATSLSLDIETDTLIVSPGVDYTRVAEPEK